MSHKLKNILPWAALAAFIIAALLLIAGSSQRSQVLVESGETLAAAERALEELDAQAPESLDEPALRSALDQTARANYIAAVWLFDQQGQIVYSSGSPLKEGSASSKATVEVARALAALPDDALSSEQRMMVLVSSTIQAEGEHADIFRYRVQPVRSGGGGTLGFIGLAYEASPAVGAPASAGYIASLLGLLAALGVYWLSLAGWVYLDAASRGERALVWAIFVLIGNFVALIAYLLARR